MATRYKSLDFDIVDNGDGTFTLSPVSTPATDVLAEYRRLRSKCGRLNRQRLQIVADLDVLRAERDALKAILDAGSHGADDDLS